jgi:predicted  nucleic acid-binding Zn-ribbon protein
MTEMTLSTREVLERLRTLQALDRRLADLDREIEEGPQAVSGLQRAVAAIDAKIAAHEERVKMLRAQVKLRENEVKTGEAKLDRLQEQASSVKTNREFTAIRSEISGAKADVSRVEEEVLKVMEAVEQEEKAIADRRADRDREQRRYDEERGKVESAIDGLRSRRAQMAKDRPGLVPEIPPAALEAYERVLKVRGNAVVPIEQDYCSGCMERLTRNDTFAVHNASRLVQCKSCNRILYTP